MLETIHQVLGSKGRDADLYLHPHWQRPEAVSRSHYGNGSEVAFCILFTFFIHSLFIHSCVSPWACAHAHMYLPLHTCGQRTTCGSSFSTMWVLEMKPRCRLVAPIVGDCHSVCGEPGIWRESQNLYSKSVLFLGLYEWICPFCSF